MNPEQQVAIVTGSCGGLGRKIVEDLLQQGFYVAATDILQEDSSWTDYPEFSTRLQYFPLDVCDLSHIKTVSQKISETFQLPITLLVNNAGVFCRHPVTKNDFTTTAQRVIEVNLLGAFNCTEVFCRYMISAKYGRIINIASIAGVYGAGHASAYAASKAGLIAASKSWAKELAGFGINVNAIAPGICQTSMLEQENVAQAQARKLLLNLIPVKRFGTPTDISELVTFLATCQTNYINGIVIEIDGGVHIPGVEGVHEPIRK